jgi:GDSL-like Lipase/Acylhydrolase family
MAGDCGRRIARRPVTAVRPSSAALFALAVAVQFAIFETGLRVWGSSEAAPSFQGLFTGDPVIGYRLAPNARIRFTTSDFDTHININSLGVRDDDEIGPKPPGERRIVVLGDSLVLSVQVAHQQTFCELLERRLNARASGVRYRVINAGVQGYGPVEELLFFRSLAAQLQPDLVLHTLFVGNDAEEALTSAPKLEGSARARSDVLRESIVTRLRRLVRRSMVLQVLRLRFVAATERMEIGQRPEPPLQSYAANPAPRIAAGLAVTHRCVGEIAAQAATLGARTAVVLMPARFQVHDGDYQHLREAVRQTGGELVRDAANARFEATLADLALPRLDLLPALRRESDGTDVFYDTTVHLTPRGHALVAAALERFLRDERLLPNGF